MSAHVRPGHYLAVALGAAIGGMLRHATGMLLPGHGFPWSTLAVNIAGTFIIGAYWGWVGTGAPVHARLGPRLAVMTGFCGGFTTFSAFGVESLDLLHRAGSVAALGYVCATLAGALAAAWLGFASLRASQLTR